MPRASRREFLACTAAALGGAGAALWPAARSFAQPAATPVPPAPDQAGRNDGRYFEWKDAAPGVKVALRMEGGNTLVLLGEGGAILVDTKNAGFGAALRREAESFGQPLKLVINTHHHFDHTGGNYAFTPDLTVAAHAKAVDRIPAQIDRLKGSVANSARAERLNQSTDPDVEKVRREIKGLLVDFPPDKAFVPNKSLDIAQGQSQTLEAAGRKAVLYYFGPAHTDNDIAVVLPDSNVIHAGDLVFNGRHPFLDRSSGGTSEGWIAVLRKLAELCDEKTVVVPGHGELTDRAGVLAQIEYFERVRAAITKAIAEGKTRDDMAGLQVEPYTAGEFSTPEPKGGTYRAIYDELSNAGRAGRGPVLSGPAVI